ncbi:MAG: SWIM zinc finger family protein [Thiolinea sp.]
MEFTYKYFGPSQVSHDAKQSALTFSPDSLRDPAFFVADLGQHLPFREAMSALHEVVVSDGRIQPKDRTEYFAWLEQEEQNQLADFMAQQEQAKAKVKPLQDELAELNKKSRLAMAPYYLAQKRYFDYLYKHDYDAWFVLDPVITVHPDQVFFECFSQDESSYGRLSCSHNVFSNISECAYGTTNIDYSDSLYQEFQKIRDYRRTQLKIDPSGFQVTTERSDEFIEQKIDLPDSWVRGFLQVNSALTLPMHTVQLHPMDVHNLCFLLRRRKEKVGPRSLRFCLKPGQPLEIIIEPWGQVLRCPRSLYQGEYEGEVRIWGRRRLFIFERLIPVAKGFTLHMLGTGLPSFWVADLGELSFTLGLSGWTANDWSRMGNFDLMAPRGEVDSATAERVIAALQREWCADSASLARSLALDETTVKSALAIYAQQGKVLYDTENQLYRLRELSGEPLPMEQLRFSNPREERAANFVLANLVQLDSPDVQEKHTRLRGVVTDNARKYQTEVLIDRDERLFDAHCSCDYFIHNKLFKGPCEHMLALRKLHSERGNQS